LATINVLAELKLATVRITIPMCNDGLTFTNIQHDQNNETCKGVKIALVEEIAANLCPSCFDEKKKLKSRQTSFKARWIISKK
jgi:hypothetical protein